MKKQHSVTDICLSILRGGLCVAVAVSVIKYILDSSSRDYIVISSLPQTTTSVSTTEHILVTEPDSASTGTPAEESCAEDPVEMPASAVTSAVSEVTYKAELPQEAYTTHITTASASASESPTETTGDRYGLINLNTASVQRLMELSGIGEVKANAIVRYREENGGFKSIDEILNVKGIGEKTFEKIRSQITV